MNPSRKTKMLRHLLGLAVAAAWAAPALAQAPVLPGASRAFAAQTEHLRASAVVSHTTVAPGQRFHVAVELQIDEGWVYYSPAPGEVAKPAKVAVEAEGLITGEVLWPADHPYRTDLGGEVIVNHVYTKRAVIYVPLRVPADASPGRRTVTVVVSGQVCGNVCVDVEAVSSAEVTVGPAAAAADAWTAQLAGDLARAMTAADIPAARAPAAPPGVSSLTIWTGLAMAMLAGLILNIMPCVLPIVPLRILSLVQMAGRQRRRMITLGLAFAGGIFLFFAALATVNVVLRLAAEHVFSLSAMLQFRSVRIALAMILVALAANLFGLFNVVVPGRLAAADPGGGAKSRGHVASLGMGMMMAVLATPCSFAILAKALAWAQIVPLWLGTLAILMIGVGMAFPHAVLAAFPQLVERLPRPGRWMELFKQSIGFLLLPVAVWLIFAGSDDAYPGWVIAYGVVLTACLWVWGTWVRYDASPGRKIVVRGLAVLLAAGAGFAMLRPPARLAVPFEAFDTGRIEQAHRDNRTVLIKFTSATCLSCLWLDRTVFSDPEVAAEIARRNIVALKADTTDAGTPASLMLRRRFRGAPPLTVLLPPGGGKPVRIDGKFTKARLFQAFDDARQP